MRHEPNGRSPITIALSTPRLAARQWWTISSIVTDVVSFCPSTTMPTESPTSTASTPAPSASRADGQSYAVTIAIASPRSRIACSVATPTFGRGFGAACCSCDRASAGSG